MLWTRGGKRGVTRPTPSHPGIRSTSRLGSDGQWRPNRDLRTVSPPGDPSAEKAVLGCVLLDGARLAGVTPILRASDFSVPANGTLYEHLVAVANGHPGPFDPNLLQARLADAGQWGERTGITESYLIECVKGATAIHAAEYARRVHELAKRRRLWRLADDLAQGAHDGRTSAAEVAATIRCKLDDVAESNEPLFPVRTCAELVAEDLRVPFYIERLFAELFPLVIAGPMKSLKTSILVAFCFALATGRLFLNHFPVTRACKVGLLSAESGLAAIRDLLIRIGKAADFPAEGVTGLFVGEDIPTIDNPEHEAGIRRLIHDRELEVIAFDPLYLGADEDSQSNLARAGQQLRRLAKVCLDEGVTPILCHHTKKGTLTKREPLDLSDLHGAGTGEFVRQWWLINRRDDYRHDGNHALWLNVGASYGHGGLWGLDISEGVWDGPGSRYWDVTVQEGDEVRQVAHEHKQAAREEKYAERFEADRRTIVDAMVKIGPDTRSAVEDATGFGRGRFGKAWASLVGDGSILKLGEVKKANGQTYPTWGLRNE
jgi:hypothetical protein